MRFIHTSDWQLGMTRHFLSAEAQARFSGAREDAIRRLGAVAEAQQAAFVVVAGDVFETNVLGPRTVGRALDALSDVPVPVYLLPGNHDPCGPGSVYQSGGFQRLCPPQVHVLAATAVVPVSDDVELVGVPWTSKRPSEDLVARCLDSLPPRQARYRVMVAHGQFERMGSQDSAAVIDPAPLEALLQEGQLHYVAMGDRHSTTEVGGTGRIWYSGAPEATDYDEVEPGNVLVVDLEPAGVQVTRARVGTWRFVEQVLAVRPGTAAAQVRDWLAALPAKSTTIVKLTLSGTIGVLDRAQVEAALDDARHLFAAVERHTHRDQLAVLPDGEDFADLELSGFQRQALAELLEGARGGGPDAERNQDALALLYRLARPS